MFTTLARISLFFGTFPYKYDRGNNELHFSYFGGTSSLVVSLFNIWLIIDLFLRLNESVAVFNPQTFLLCFIWVNAAVIILHRLWRRKYIQNLYSQLLHFHDQQNTASYKWEKWQFYFLLLVMIVEDMYVVGLSCVNVLMRLQTMTVNQFLRVVVFTFCLVVTVMAPPSIEWQYVTQCVMLRCSLAKLNKNLENILKQAPVVEQHLIGNRLRRTQLMRILKAVNGEYGFELLMLSNTLMLLSIYLCNDILLLVRTGDEKGLWQSLSAHKLGLNVTCLFASFARLYWLCRESEKLAAEVKNTEKIILKQDIAGFPTNIFIQAEKYIFSLNQPQNSLALCGFFYLNMKFAFNVIGNVVAFVLIFIQLNGSDNWIQ